MSPRPGLILRKLAMPTKDGDVRGSCHLGARAFIAKAVSFTRLVAVIGIERYDTVERPA